MAEFTHHTRGLKKVHGSTDITRIISIVIDGPNQFVVQVVDTFCRNDDPRGRCTDEKQCFRTFERSDGTSSVEEAIALADSEFVRSVKLEDFKPCEHFSESLFILTT